MQSSDEDEDDGEEDDGDDDDDVTFVSYFLPRTLTTTCIVT